MSIKTIFDDLGVALAAIKSKTDLTDTDHAAVQTALSGLQQAEDGIAQMVSDEVTKQLAALPAASGAVDLTSVTDRLSALEGNVSDIQDGLAELDAAVRSAPAATSAVVPAAPVAQAAGQKVFSPETDAPTTTNLNAATTGVKAPASAPAQPTIVAPTGTAQVDAAQSGEVAAIQPDPAADPGSTGSVAELAPDGSTKVAGSVSLNGGASVLESTTDPNQTPPPSAPTAPSTTTEQAQPLGGDSAVIQAQPVTVEDAPAVIEQPATSDTDTASAGPVAVADIDPDTNGTVIVTQHPETSDILSTPVASDPTPGTVVVDPETGVPSVDPSLVPGASDVTLGETTAAHPDIQSPVDQVLLGVPDLTTAAPTE